MHEGLVDCSALGRTEPPARYSDVMISYLNRQSDADKVSVCEIPRFTGSIDYPKSDYHKCAYDLHPDIETQGYCIIDPSQGLGSSELTTMCADGHKRRVRMIPSSLPLPETTSMLICDYG